MGAIYHDWGFDVETQSARNSALSLLQSCWILLKTWILCTYDMHSSSTEGSMMIPMEILNWPIDREYKWRLKMFPTLWILELCTRIQSLSSETLQTRWDIYPLVTDRNFWNIWQLVKISWLQWGAPSASANKQYRVPGHRVGRRLISSSLLPKTALELSRSSPNNCL